MRAFPGGFPAGIPRGKAFSASARHYSAGGNGKCVGMCPMVFAGHLNPPQFPANAARPAPRCLPRRCDASYDAKATVWGGLGATPRRLCNIKEARQVAVVVHPSTSDENGSLAAINWPNR